jgi:hypothetical protein
LMKRRSAEPVSFSNVTAVMNSIALVCWHETVPVALDASN